MLRVYTTPSCSSCRKVKAYLTKYDIPFFEIDLFRDGISVKDLQAILALSNGVDDIISVRSKLGKALKLEEMSLQSLLAYASANPTIIKRPIILDRRRIQVGYNKEEIEIFLPRELREAYLHE